MRLPLLISSTLLLTACASTPYSPKQAENTSTTQLCYYVYHLGNNPERLSITKKELGKRGMDWRSIQCEQAADQKKASEPTIMELYKNPYGLKQ